MAGFSAHFFYISISMDAVLRALQGVGDARPAPFVAFVDEVQTFGGDAILKKVRLILLYKMHFTCNWI
jgi:hypothetical protein